MLSYAAFAALRLSQFAPPDEIVPLDNWEFLDQIWVGEAIGFSEWLRPRNNSNALESLALDLSELPASVSGAVLAKLGLPLKAGMRLHTIAAMLGEPTGTANFVDDRTTYEFRCGEPESYDVSCTVHDTVGLLHIAVTVPSSGVGRDA
jgi:hypothetical protein